MKMRFNPEMCKRYIISGGLIIGLSILVLIMQSFRPDDVRFTIFSVGSLIFGTLTVFLGKYLSQVTHFIIDENQITLFAVLGSRKTQINIIPNDIKIENNTFYLKIKNKWKIVGFRRTSHPEDWYNLEVYVQRLNSEVSS